MSFRLPRRRVRPHVNQPRSSPMPSWPSRRISHFSVARLSAEELVVQAKELGIVGLGIADRNSVAGVVRAHKSKVWPRKRKNARTMQQRKILQKRSSQLRIQIAVGARLVFSDGSPDILAYPEDRAAWGRLTRLLTLGKDRAEKGDCILKIPRFIGRSRKPEFYCSAARRINAKPLVNRLVRLKEASLASPSGWEAACFIGAMIAADWRD